MRILIDLNHPKDINIFRNVIHRLILDGHSIKIVAANKENMVDILDSYGFEYETKPHYNGLVNKIVGMVKNDYRLYKIAMKFNADIFASFGSPYAAQVSRILGKDHISFSDTDSDKATINQFVLTTLLFSKVDYVPECHRIDRGKKQKKFNGYYELSYLHPLYFKPNPDVLFKLGLSPEDRYIVVRFSALNAHHDIGAEGFNFRNEEEILTYIKNLSAYAKVFLTTEIKLSPTLEKYKPNVSATDFHSFLFYSSLYVGEGASMAAEAAILGVPSIYISNTTRGYLEELENKYKLCYTIVNKEEALNKAISLFEPNVKSLWAEKRMKMLDNKIDVVEFIVDAIEKET
ncbi:DUF354 domain-containing protein [Methanolobus halotolerans]|uniref:DUF354 domain-containing protein n=1 Tax=Methanolobus halotolerans TaxID=2052935 RepID=A0A4E0Q9H2_9EURY|nr:DUF354 domain-containing protein [Methanolobus halotolerans]TGC11560.1 hypothetical protein CUN85_01455 [Methanolobus halotolerans]